MFLWKTFLFLFVFHCLMNHPYRHPSDARASKVLPGRACSLTALTDIPISNYCWYECQSTGVMSLLSRFAFQIFSNVCSGRELYRFQMPQQASEGQGSRGEEKNGKQWRWKLRQIFTSFTWRKLWSCSKHSELFNLSCNETRSACLLNLRRQTLVPRVNLFESKTFSH